MTYDAGIPKSMVAAPASPAIRQGDSFESAREHIWHGFIGNLRYYFRIRLDSTRRNLMTSLPVGELHVMISAQQGPGAPGVERWTLQREDTLLNDGGGVVMRNEEAVAAAGRRAHIATAISGEEEGGA